MTVPKTQAKCPARLVLRVNSARPRIPLNQLSVEQAEY